MVNTSMTEQMEAHKQLLKQETQTAAVNAEKKSERNSLTVADFLLGSDWHV
jgi:hypothetical protein